MASTVTEPSGPVIPPPGAHPSTRRRTVGAIALAVIVTSTMVAYVRVPNRPDGTGRGGGGRR